jgi:hypothetical protein
MQAAVTPGLREGRRRRSAKRAAMPIVFCFVALGLTFALYAVARVALRVMERLAIDPMTLLLWFGLAEDPVEEPRSDRRRLNELLGDSVVSAPRPSPR